MLEDITRRVSIEAYGNRLLNKWVGRPHDDADNNESYPREIRLQGRNCLDADRAGPYDRTVIPKNTIERVVVEKYLLIYEIYKIYERYQNGG
jgi:hypothetical protein